MHDRAPRGTCALEVYPASRMRPGHQVVQHEVETQPRRDSVGRCTPEKGGAELVAGQSTHVALNHHLRNAIWRHRIQVGVFSQHIIPGGTVIAARRREDETLYTGLDGKPRDTHRSV